jgi:mono/diheme cytochrome c family protein
MTLMAQERCQKSFISDGTPESLSGSKAFFCSVYGMDLAVKSIQGIRLMRTLFAAFLVLLIIVVLWMISGTYNVAAVEPHPNVMEWLLAAVRDRSVAHHSQEITPPSLQDPALVQAGLREYHTMCFTCHAAPGYETSAIGKGLNPEPPKLEAEQVQARSDAELYWIIQNGLRMTGMPAFGPTHDEKTLWSLVAFLRQLPETDRQEYAAMVEAAGLQATDYGHVHRHTHPQS